MLSVQTCQGASRTKEEWIQESDSLGLSLRTHELHVPRASGIIALLFFTLEEGTVTKKNVERKSEEHDHETEKCLSDAVSIILYIILLEACISFTRTVMMTNTKKS